MVPRVLTARLAAGLATAALFLAPAAGAQSASESFYRAYWLEHAQGEHQTAYELYRSVAEDGRAAAEMRQEARRAANALAEEINAGDFARLMPAETILYAELNRPGEQLAGLFDQLGLLGDGGERFGLSPLLLNGALGLRGAAIAITAIDPRQGPQDGVIVLHPGDLDLVRGLIETALPAGGTPVEAIGGHATYDVEGKAFVTITSRLVVAAPTRAAVEGVVERLHGSGGPSLADDEAMSDAMATRGDDLLFFCVNAEPILPMIQAAIQQETRRDPQAAMAVTLLDLESLRAAAGRVSLAEGGGIALDLSLHLDQGHHNLIFNLLRMPSVQKGTLELVPEGAAFFLATALNPPAPRASLDGHGQEPIVTLMDFGREVFGNISDVAVFGLPPTSAGGPPIPDVAAIVRVNDPARSRALWSFVLGLASQASGEGSMAPAVVDLDGVEAEQYTFEGVPVYLVTRANELLISPSRSAIARALEAQRKGRSVLNDPVYAACAESLNGHSTFALMVNPGRCGRIAERFMPPSEAARMKPFLSLLDETVVSLGVEHSDTHCALRARIHDLPDVSGLVRQAIAARRTAAGAARPARAVAVRSDAGGHGDPQPRRSDLAAIPRAAEEKQPYGWGPGTSSGLAARFDELACVKRDRAAAAACARELVEAMGEDAQGLNNFAWALLTEERYGNEYDEVALKVSKRSNELSGYASWYYLDTLALALFRAGDVAKAVELQSKAVELAGDDPLAEEARAALKRYQKALSGKTAVGG